jgi:hypothetical protein
MRSAPFSKVNPKYLSKGYRMLSLSGYITTLSVSTLYTVDNRMMITECAEAGGLRIGRGNRSTHRTPAPVPLCRPQIPHDLTDNCFEQKF